jgi:hypothetical protein
MPLPAGYHVRGSGWLRMEALACLSHRLRNGAGQAPKNRLPTFLSLTPANRSESNSYRVARFVRLQ